MEENLCHFQLAAYPCLELFLLEEWGWAGHHLVILLLWQAALPLTQSQSRVSSKGFLLLVLYQNSISFSIFYSLEGVEAPLLGTGILPSSSGHYS